VERQHIRLLLSLALTGFLAVGGPEAAVAAGEPPATITLRATATTRHLLSIEPGFTLFLVFDAPIELVAIGDEQLLAIAVRASAGVVGLKASQRAGRTNVHVQSGGVLIVFEARVGSAPRSADVVHVVTAGVAHDASGRSPTPPQRSPAESAVSAPSASLPPTAPPSVPVNSPEAAALPVSTPALPGSFLSPATLFQVQDVTESGIHGTFQAYRTAGGIEIRYELHNTSTVPWKLATRRVLIRADGQIVSPGAKAQAANGATPILALGATEGGVLKVGQLANTVELLFPLFTPLSAATQPPLLLSVRFAGLDTLVEVKPR